MATSLILQILEQNNNITSSLIQKTIPLKIPLKTHFYHLLLHLGTCLPCFNIFKANFT